MASGDWPVLWNSGSSSNTYTWNGSYTTSAPYIVTSGGSGGGSGGGGWTAPAPRPPTALEWLEAETEAVCKLARHVA